MLSLKEGWQAPLGATTHPTYSLAPGRCYVPKPSPQARGQPAGASPCPQQSSTAREAKARGFKVRKEDFRQTELVDVTWAFSEIGKDFLTNAFLLAQLGLAETTPEAGTITLQKVPQSWLAGAGSVPQDRKTLSPWSAQLLRASWTQPRLPNAEQRSGPALAATQTLHSTVKQAPAAAHGARHRPRARGPPRSSAACVEPQEGTGWAQQGFRAHKLTCGVSWVASGHGRLRCCRKGQLWAQPHHSQAAERLASPCDPLGQATKLPQSYAFGAFFPWVQVTSWKFMFGCCQRSCLHSLTECSGHSSLA